MVNSETSRAVQRGFDPWTENWDFAGCTAQPKREKKLRTHSGGKGLARCSLCSLMPRVPTLATTPSAPRGKGSWNQATYPFQKWHRTPPPWLPCRWADLPRKQEGRCEEEAESPALLAQVSKISSHHGQCRGRWVKLQSSRCQPVLSQHMTLPAESCPLTKPGKSYEPSWQVYGNIFLLKKNQELKQLYTDKKSKEYWRSYLNWFKFPFIFPTHGCNQCKWSIVCFASYKSYWFMQTLSCVEITKIAVT